MENERIIAGACDRDRRAVVVEELARLLRVSDENDSPTTGAQFIDECFRVGKAGFEGGLHFFRTDAQPTVA